MFDILISPSAERDLKDLPKNELKRIIEVIDSLRQTCFPKQCDIKKLKGYSNSYRLRVGSWRIIYEIHFKQNEIIIGSILKRKHAYRKR